MEFFNIIVVKITSKLHYFAAPIVKHGALNLRENLHKKGSFEKFVSFMKCFTRTLPSKVKNMKEKICKSKREN